MSPVTPSAASTLTEDNYRFLQQYVQRESGIALGKDKQYLVESRLTPLLAAERLSSLDELCARLRQGATEPLRRRIVESMTTHETFFFRDIAVFDAIRTGILPELAGKRKLTKSLRIWSAASSSGQEAYSLAMMLLENGFSDWNVEILGTDLSGQILDRARAARYLQIEVNRGLPASLLVKYFQRAGLDWELKPVVRQKVRFAPFDLRQSMTALGTFDLVLCRNVLIYFDTDTRRRILAGIRSRLHPGAYLLLGSSETTFNLDDKFVRKTVGSSVVYQNPG